MPLERRASVAEILIAMDEQMIIMSSHHWAITQRYVWTLVQIFTSVKPLITLVNHVITVVGLELLAQRTAVQPAMTLLMLLWLAANVNEHLQIIWSPHQVYEIHDTVPDCIASDL